MKYLVEVEKATETAGPAYRNALAENGHLQPPPGLNSCWDIFSSSVEKYPNNPMLGHRRVVDGEASEYAWMTYKEVYDVVMKLAGSISTTRVKQGERCGIYGVNCPEWIISLEACNALGVCTVPLYDSLGAGAVEFIICHAEIQIAFVEEKKIKELLKMCHGTSKYLKTIVSFGVVTSDHKEEAKTLGLSIFSWEEFLINDGYYDFDLPEKKKSDICTILYTSGTTGEPKGVMIPNESLIANILSTDFVMKYVGEAFDQDDIYMSYLPLAHIFDRVFEESFIYHGSKIGYWQGDPKLLVDDIAALRPTILCVVPRVLDKIYSGLTFKISSSGILKKTLFNTAYKLKLARMHKGTKHEKATPIFDKLVFNKVKEGLGGHLRVIVFAGAPLAMSVEEFFRVATCAYVVQVYGLTEICGGISVSIPNEFSMLGTVGPPIQNIDVRLESVPEMGCDALSRTPRGEICVRGSFMFSGYYKRDDLTREVLIDEWFHTGDIGEWIPDGSLKIIDRKKNIFKLSQGEYVAAENLENMYNAPPEIDSIWIYGNSFESFLVAIINPNQQALEHWAQQNGICGSFAEICENSRVKEHILSELTKIAREMKLRGFEFIKAIHLDPIPFDMERDLITPTFKKKRPQMLKHYQGAIDALYMCQATQHHRVA
ncbi:hypothetical protein HU200_035715 [Digitaria exilis]|uniref:Long-chain-fatty-acid--CoA ligase n=1 Tax=Digitaria exilis TaxID=1010633 RepID=A0A835BIH4_9POAL|nr:hypothetical protein HU200_035715 [Digitaria exilis]